MRLVLERASLATLAGLVPHYLAFYLLGSPLWTEAIAEWIMARTPSSYALWILGSLGAWAKPFAMTGGLAVLGFAVTMVASIGRRWLGFVGALAAAAMLGWWFGYSSVAGQLAFWVPVVAVLAVPAGRPALVDLRRRQALVMMSGTVLVAAESFFRDESLARRAAVPRGLAPFDPPAESFAAGLVRKAVTPVETFYAMSKNTVDPALDARQWRLRISVDGRPMRSVSYGELLSMASESEYVTLRCISNTLQSDLMGTALWTGVRLHQLVDRRSLPDGIVEAAVVGVDGHGDSFSPQYLLSEDVMLAVGMNGKTLDRTHGFPVRLIVPRYYGFKNVKWIGEIAFLRKPYFGTWPKMGYTKEPVVHTASHIDKIVRSGGGLRVGGVSFAGDRGIRAAQIRADRGEWVDVTLERPLARFTWTRWHGLLNSDAKVVEARAMDGTGKWQAADEGPLFPDGVKGPTVRRVS